MYISYRLPILFAFLFALVVSEPSRLNAQEGAVAGGKQHDLMTKIKVLETIDTRSLKIKSLALWKDLLSQQDAISQSDFSSLILALCNSIRKLPEGIDRGKLAQQKAARRALALQVADEALALNVDYSRMNKLKLLHYSGGYEKDFVPDLVGADKWDEKRISIAKRWLDAFAELLKVIEKGEPKEKVQYNPESLFGGMAPDKEKSPEKWEKYQAILAENKRLSKMWIEYTQLRNQKMEYTHFCKKYMERLFNDDADVLEGLLENYPASVQSLFKATE